MRGKVERMLAHELLGELGVTLLQRLDDLLFGLAHDEYASARLGAKKSLLLEQRHRLADRRPAHPERLAKLTLVQPDLLPVRINIGLHDGLLQRGVGLVAEADVGGERLQRKRWWFGDVGHVGVRSLLAVCARGASPCWRVISFHQSSPGICLPRRRNTP